MTISTNETPTRGDELIENESAIEGFGRGAMMMTVFIVLVSLAASFDLRGWWCFWVTKTKTKTKRCCAAHHFCIMYASPIVGEMHVSLPTWPPACLPAWSAPCPYVCNVCTSYPVPF